MYWENMNTVRIRTTRGWYQQHQILEMQKWKHNKENENQASNCAFK